MDLPAAHGALQLLAYWKWGSFLSAFSMRFTQNETATSSDFDKAGGLFCPGEVDPGVTFRFISDQVVDAHLTSQSMLLLSKGITLIDDSLNPDSPMIVVARPNFLPHR
jgi:hypothetical protein